ncbi:MAG: lytic transglycosylase domain-containing protein [Nitrospinae bacterium]|nr:lytic transglycosylase domain-containing protein [Nitrospinota bacterium]
MNPMLDINLIEKMQSALSSSPVSAKVPFPNEKFYSLLLKHQLNMIKAWSTSKPDSSFSLDGLNFTETLRNLKNIQFTSAPEKTMNPRQVLQSYTDTRNSKPDSIFSSKDSLVELADRVAAKNNVPESLFQKLIQAESSFDPKAKSSRGAMGLGQLMPATAKELGLSLKEDDSIGSVWHPESNLDASARYLRKLFDKYTRQGIPENEAWNFAAGAYNAGMGNIGRAIEKLGKVEEWDQVAAVLPQVTGRFSSETIKYVNRLRA